MSASDAFDFSSLLESLGASAATPGELPPDVKSSIKRWTDTATLDEIIQERDRLTRAVRDPTRTQSVTDVLEEAIRGNIPEGPEDQVYTLLMMSTSDFFSQLPQLAASGDLGCLHQAFQAVGRKELEQKSKKDENAVSSQKISGQAVSTSLKAKLAFIAKKLKDEPSLGIKE